MQQGCEPFELPCGQPRKRGIPERVAESELVGVTLSPLLVVYATTHFSGSVSDV
ncbi:MAG: hypothetical protein AVDCRST_MAG58-455 [uncultured Rubrobacteraceae bacterium]|uniref:Uncharacterized protein n=1 Tax=uncultured Rubrobacteraceae bacterium TaxID=349277 RepID=A0A6J4QJB5_9ACTN|nr:MAG: hypothetical protein AVDCRST_MAG58-455 [uncultured Rubrobacteraceae bacterium]